MGVFFVFTLLLSVYLIYKYWFDPVDKYTYNEKFKGKYPWYYFESHRLFICSGRIVSILVLVFSIYMIIYELANN